VTLGEFTGRVWRYVHRDGDGARFEFDATIDGLIDASGSGLGDKTQRLCELASVVICCRCTSKPPTIVIGTSSSS
jgi:hypothetical protein